MTIDGAIIRQARQDEADQIATVARISLEHFLPYLPKLHSLEDDKAFYRNHVFAECDVWVAEKEQEIIGVCAFQEGWVNHLYLLPQHVGRTYGASLLNKAKERHAYLQLWVFQRNERAQSFYRRHGFQKVKKTDGQTNDEKTADALYEWRKPQ